MSELPPGPPPVKIRNREKTLVNLPDNMERNDESEPSENSSGNTAPVDLDPNFEPTLRLSSNSIIGSIPVQSYAEYNQVSFRTSESVVMR